MKIFLAQINPTVGNLEGNAERILYSVSQAYENQANLVITPELSLWGYPPRDLLFQKNLISEQNLLLDDLAKKIAKKYSNLGITIGIVEQIKDNYFPDLYNAIAFIHKGKWSIIARKIIIPNYEVFDEQRYFRSENKVSILEKSFDNKVFRIGLTICEDLWVNKNIEGRGVHKENPINGFNNKKIDCLLNLSASPYTFNKLEERLKISNYAATKLNVPLIYMNQVGGNDDLIFDGNSFIMDKNGSVIKKLKSFKEDLYCWNFNITESLETLDKNEIKLESIFNALVLGLKDYAKKCRFNTVLIGLSGGIDSALVTVIASAALGSKNVFCISMPSKWNSNTSIIDAEEFAKRLKINFETVPINNLYENFENTFKNNLNLKLKGIANENIQSRIRGTFLMALANQKNHLLLSTGNKSELAVGYCTLYGDMNGGLSVIGDLYKTNVFKLCSWLDSNSSINSRMKYKLPITPLIGEKIFNKPPSAELGPNQLDIDSLPPYSVLDKVLKGIIEEKKDFNQLKKDGHEIDLIKQIVGLIKKSEFKRKQAPPILKLSSQSLGSDWRLPIAISK